MTQKQKTRNVTLKLKFPVVAGEEEIKELTLKPPTAGDIEHLSANPTMKELLLIASKCSLTPPSIIKKIDSHDAIKLTEVVADFLDGGQKTGKAAW